MDHMHWTAYNGEERTFVTHLSVEECVQQLWQHAPDTTSGAYVDTSTWMPLLTPSDVDFKMRGQQFALRVRQPHVPNQLYWSLDGALQASDVGTIITALYSADGVNNVSIWGVYSLTLLGIAQLVRTGLTSGWSQQHWLIAVFLGFGGLAVSGVARRNTKAQAEERALLTTLQHVFHAHEVDV